MSRAVMILKRASKWERGGAALVEGIKAVGRGGRKAFQAAGETGRGAARAAGAPEALGTVGGMAALGTAGAVGAVKGKRKLDEKIWEFKARHGLIPGY